MKEKMPKVVPLKKSDVVETLTELLNMARSGEITSFMAAGFLKDESVFTTVIGPDPIEQHMLVSHLNANAIIRTVKAGLSANE
jgi:hypothetical protein